MQVFLSWSGDKGGEIAKALRGWLPLVLQAVKPWMSKRDISAGSHWLVELNEALAKADAGIVCVTEENLQEPWMLFESGGLLKAVDKPFVCPYLIDLPPAKLSGPLGQFQGMPADRQGTLDLLNTLKGKLPPDSRPEADVFATSFETFWPKLEEQVKQANGKDRKAPKGPPSKEDAVLAGIRQLARNQEGLMKQIDQVGGLVESRLQRQGNSPLPLINPFEWPPGGDGESGKPLGVAMAEVNLGRFGNFGLARQQGLEDAMQPLKEALQKKKEGGPTGGGKD